MSIKVAWQSPSNIALIKYWGKKKEGVQLPANASISFTLSSCYTETHLSFNEDEDFGVKVSVEGKSEPAFEPKILKFFDRIEASFPFIKAGSYVIDTKNTFPHSSGIASSASGMSALALCICSIAKQKGLLKEEDFYSTASELARLGSGSACRSVYGPLASWGEHPSISGSTDLYATSFSGVHEVFKDFGDTILLVHKGEKSISSTVGHGLLDGHPFAAERYNVAQNNLTELLNVLRAGDLDRFISIVESEALMLHAMMMSSDPYFILMKPNTLAIIELIWKKRNEDGKKWLFTLDAGANVHFLYPKADEQEAIKFVDNELTPYCQDGAYICDQVGNGPKELTT